jgi:hypothetical protein
MFYFAITKATPNILSSMKIWGAFLFFALWCLTALVYVFFMVPETSGRSLESIDGLFEHKWHQMRKHAYEKEEDVEEKSTSSIQR